MTPRSGATVTRSHSKRDPAIKSLAAICRALDACPERMREANLRFAWDKYVEAPRRKRLAEAGVRP